MNTRLIVKRASPVEISLGIWVTPVPAGLTAQELPVGLELDGLPGDDEALLGLGVAVEQVLGSPSSPGPVG